MAITESEHPRSATTGHSAHNDSARKVTSDPWGYGRAQIIRFGILRLASRDASRSPGILNFFWDCIRERLQDRRLMQGTCGRPDLIRCRIRPCTDQGGACGAAGPAPAPRTPGRRPAAQLSDGSYVSRSGASQERLPRCPACGSRGRPCSTGVGWQLSGGARVRTRS